ncbi:MAG TPA: serine hydrolase domain-containing protein [Bryobacteraceae bacterium]|nr:serine hydrolase domain-containing protein [Bryobacteraceae bacterium]HUO27851.1 serine hydrolase domain-containing protein [Bryobacteraceae bacterium]
MRRSVFLLSVIAAAALAAPPASIQTAKPEQTGFSSERFARIHEMVQRHIEAHDISGAVTLVARYGKVAHFEAHGLADIDAKKPMAKDSLFWIMSMTKPVVGTSVLMMMEEGRLRLTDPVSKFIPEFKDMKVAVIEDRPAGAPAAAPGTPPLFYTIPAAREITIQDLLTHVSGLNSGGPASTAEVAKIALKAGESLADYIPRLGTTPLDFQPGTRWQYSPTAAFDTLERVVEVVSGQPFDRFARERIFDPLGMKDTGYRPSPEQLARIATQYRGADGALTRVANKPIWLNSPTYLSGGGGLVSSAEDYLQFAQMLANRGELNGNRLLGPKTVELMSSVFVPDTLPGRAKGRGFGLSVQVITDHIAANTPISNGSFGWDGAFGTHFWVDPKEKIVGIFMVQASRPNRSMNPDFENAVMQALIEPADEHN